jgi:hypothetical protein
MVLPCNAAAAAFRTPGSALDSFATSITAADPSVMVLPCNAAAAAFRTSGSALDNCDTSKT